MRHRTLFVTLTAILTCALVAGGLSAASAASKPTGKLKSPVIIGQIAALTGAFQAYGEMQQQGFHVGLLYATKGTMKVAGAKIVVKTYNEASATSGLPDAPTAVAAATGAIENDKAQILQCCSSSADAVQVAGVAAKYQKILMVAPAASNALAGVNRYTFRTSREDSQDALTGAKYATQKFGKSYMFMAQDYAFGHDQQANWKTQLDASGGNDVGDVYFPLTATDFTPYIQQVLAKKPNFLVVACAGAQCLSLWKQMVQLGLPDQVKIMTGLPNIAAIPAFGDAAAKMGFISVYYNTFPSKKLAANNYLVKMIKKLYNREADIFDQDSFAAAQQIVAALEKTHSTNGQKMIKALEGQTVQGPKGPYTIRKADHVCLQDMYIAQVQVNGTTFKPIRLATKSAKSVAPAVQAHNW